MDDLNRAFAQLKRDNIGTGGYWTPWDTKSNKGLEDFRLRLANSMRTGRPFNNEIVENGIKSFLPTIWFSRTCVNIIESMKKWKWSEWGHRDRLVSNDPKGDSSGAGARYSHFPIAIESLLKCPELAMARFRQEMPNPVRDLSDFSRHDRPVRRREKRYFQAGGR